MEVIDKLRPIVNCGMAPEAYRNMMKELHRKRYDLEVLVWEEKLHQLPATRAQRQQKFSSFSEKGGYGGFCPSANYIRTIYKRWQDTVRPHYDQQVKMRTGECLDVDASYKLKNRLCKYRGEAVFGTTVTGTNEYTEIRLQHFAVSDAFDQMRQQLKELQTSVKAFGQAPIRMVKVDNPAQVKALYEATMTTIQQGSAAEQPAATLPMLPVDMAKVRVHSTVQSVNHLAQGLSLFATENSPLIISLDAEWDTTVDPNTGRVVAQSDRIALLQLGFDLGDGPQVALCQLNRIKQLPTELLDLLRNSDVKFVGRNVGGDLNRLQRNFARSPFTTFTCRTELGKFCRERAPHLVPDGKWGLDRLTRAVLGYDLPKGAVRFSQWSASTLTDQQKLYAAADAIAGLRVYRAVVEMPDRTARLTGEAQQDHDGMQVDIMPSRGSTAVMANSCAVGVVKTPTSRQWLNPVNHKIVPVTAHRRLVQITTVHAAAFQLPKYLGVPDAPHRDVLTLGDFKSKMGDTFEVLLPLNTLRPHIENVTLTPGDSDTDAPSDLDAGTQTAHQGDATVVDADADAPSEAAHQGDDPDDSEDAIPGQAGDQHDALQELFGIDTESHVDISNHDVAVISACLSKVQEKAAAAVDSAQCGSQPCFSYTLGDVFHMQDRPKPPTHHRFKKAYFVCLRDAFLMFDPEILAEVKEALRRKHKLTEEDIEAKLLFNFDYFRRRVPRVCPPAHILHARVQAVFQFFGRLQDPEHGPLFNERAWSKAAGVLQDIAAGLVSDPPGANFYQYILNPAGEIMRDKDGIALLRSTRGTNIPEAIHRLMVHRFGGYNMGLELSDKVFAEFRHRHNVRASERYRLGFPCIGHFDTWLTDKLECLYQRNHGRQRHEGWSCAMDYAPTPETFGIVRLSIDPVAVPDIPQAVLKKLTPDQKYFANRLHMAVPTLPVATKAERVLFSRLMAQHTDDFEAMASAWSKHVDAVSIFPKIPVQLRLYCKHWQKSKKVKDAVKEKAYGIAKLHEILEVKSRRYHLNLITVWCRVMSSSIPSR